MKEAITKSELSGFSAEFQAKPGNIVAMNATTANGIPKAAMNNDTFRENRHMYSISLEQGEITNQKQSGRCWMFAALNVMRADIIKRLKLDNFELSQNFLFFYDKLEKANCFLENILSTLDEPTNGRLIDFLLRSPLNDGGQWDMFCNLVNKYGVVPKDAMPETVSSSASRSLVAYMTTKLREDACILRTDYQEGSSTKALREQKTAMLQDIYNMLCIALGTPPETFDFEARDKDKKFIRDENMAGRTFYEKYVGWNLDDYVSLINAPTVDKPYYATYTVKMLGNVQEGRIVKYLNLPIEEVKAAAIHQLQDSEAVWFGCDVGQESLREAGIMSLGAVDVSGLFGTSFGMDKAQRLDYGESLMTHAMVFQGVNLDINGKSTRWRVENSWGDKGGKSGYYVMSDDWFDQYTYQVVVHKKHLTTEQVKLLELKPKVLEPWDPMGSLASS